MARSPWGEGMSLAYIHINNIKVDVAEGDKRFSRSKIQALAKSIREYGLLHPVFVVPDGDGYRVVDGNRRVLAFKYLSEVYGDDYSVIPAFVVDMPEENMDLAPLINQLQEKYNTLTLAKIIKELRDKGYSIRKIANVLGISRTNVHRIVKLLTLPKSLQQEFLEGRKPLREIDSIDAKSLRKGQVRKKNTGVPRGTLSDMDIFTQRGKLRMCAVCLRTIVRDQVQHLYLCSDCLADISGIIRACRRYGITLYDVIKLLAKKYGKGVKDIA